MGSGNNAKQTAPAAIRKERRSGWLQRPRLLNNVKRIESAAMRRRRPLSMTMLRMRLLMLIMTFLIIRAMIRKRQKSNGCCKILLYLFVSVYAVGFHCIFFDEILFKLRVLSW